MTSSRLLDIGDSYEPRDLVGKTVFVKEHGLGGVLEFAKSRIGSSSHVIMFEEGGKQKVVLARNGKGQEFLVRLEDDDGAAEGAAPDEGAEGSADRSSFSRDESPAGLSADGSARSGGSADEEARGEGELIRHESDEEDLDDEDDLDDLEDDLGDDEGDDDGDETDEDFPMPPMPQRTRSEEWTGADDPGYVRHPVMDGLMPFGAREEEEEEMRERESIKIPEGWETAVSRSTGKTYFINTITGESQYEWPAGPAKMYASDSELSDMEQYREEQYKAAEEAAAAETAEGAEDTSEVSAAADEGGEGSEAAAAGAEEEEEKAAEKEKADSSPDPTAVPEVSDDAPTAEGEGAPAPAPAPAPASEEDDSAVAASAAAAELIRQSTPAVGDGAADPVPEAVAEPAPEVSPDAEAPAAAKEEPEQEEKPAKTWECMPVRFYYEPGKTGFEASTEYAAVPDELIIGRYKIVKFLGEGAFSKAIQCIDMERRAPICMKIVKCGDRKDYFDQSLDEIKLLQYINGGHESMDAVHIFSMHDFFYHKEHLFIVCEALGKDLYEMSKREQQQASDKYFTLRRLQNIGRQTLEALRYLQSLKLLHNDLKPENILIKDVENADIKIIDFGSACFITDHLGSYVQSRTYRAPEVILGMKYDYKIDVWSLGCILAELWTGNVLLDPKEPDLITGEPAIPTIPCLLARMAAIIGAHTTHNSALEN